MHHRHLRVLAIALLGGAMSACCSGDSVEMPSPGPEKYVALRPRALHAISDRDAVLVGALQRREDGRPEGLILLTRSRGDTWKRVGFEVHDLRGVTCTGACFVDRLRGWVAGVRTHPEGRKSAFVMRTEDGGNRWREIPLAVGKGEVTNVEDLAFENDTSGSCAVRLRRGADELVTRFVTADGGRSWQVVRSSFMVAPSGEAADPLTSFFVEGVSGWRVRRGSEPNHYWVETTASGAADGDWAPRSELRLQNLDTWYGYPGPARP